MVLDVNREAAKISSKLEVADRIDALPESEAFLSFKDHKPNFPMRKEVRLLNPSKSNIGKISKKFLFFGYRGFEHIPHVADLFTIILSIQHTVLF